jgi:hypothetical protein
MVFFILCAVMPVTAMADTLIFKNDDRLTGQLVGISAESCFYSLGIGPQPLQIVWGQIKSLKTSEEYLLTLKNGDRLTGKLEYQDGGGLFILSNRIGAMPVSVEQLQDFQVVSDTEQQDKQASLSAALGKEQSADSANTEQSTNAKQKFGQEDAKDTPPDTYLRGSTVLLAPRQIEGRLSFTYLPKEMNSVLMRRQQRSLITTLGVNVGIVEGLEGWVNLPFSYISSRQDGFTGSGRVKKFDINDISFGLNKILVRENQSLPEISVSASGTAPTGKSNYDVGEIYTTGNGHWHADTGLHFLWTADPAVIFMGATAGYTWPKHLDSQQTYSYGWDYSYYLGTGFAVNEKVSFSGRFLGAYTPAVKYNGDREGRYSTDSFYASLGVGYRMYDNVVFEPQLTFGLNNASDMVQFGLGFSKKFQ